MLKKIGLPVIASAELLALAPHQANGIAISASAAN